MAAPANTLTPQVAGIHWDDLTGLFRLKATFELQTPLGNYEKEFIITASTLALVIQELVSIWSGAVPSFAADKVTYPLGDMAALAAYLTSLPAVVQVTPEMPTIPAPDTSTDESWGTYTGAHPEGGGEPWGATVPPPR